VLVSSTIVAVRDEYRRRRSHITHIESPNIWHFLVA
jgi:hypothetical protein